MIVKTEELDVISNTKV